MLGEWCVSNTPGIQQNFSHLQDFVRAPRLNFSIDTMFSIGSPLGVFLCLRGYRPENGSGAHNDIIPVSSCRWQTCNNNNSFVKLCSQICLLTTYFLCCVERRIFNVFHPADPVAYRLEPLILPHYSKILPEQVSFRQSCKF